MTVVPAPTPIYRFIHVDNLQVCLRRGGLHAPNHTPGADLEYRTIHNVDIQNVRRERSIRCGPKGVMHDYVPFYFGPRSPMLYQLKTGQVPEYTEGQDPLIYLVSTVETVSDGGGRFVFSDGHGIAYFTTWFDDPGDLDKVDWETVYAKYWFDTTDDPDRQRRKQAEFLIHKFCDWNWIREIGVLNADVKSNVDSVLNRFPRNKVPPVQIRPDWYY